MVRTRERNDEDSVVRDRDRPANSLQLINEEKARERILERANADDGEVADVDADESYEFALDLRSQFKETLDE